MSMDQLPRFPGYSRKNDALFLYGAIRPKPFIFVYEHSSTEIVHGPSCRREEEIRLEKCQEDGVPVVERRNGGGTVVLSPGMVVTVIVGERYNLSAAVCFNRIHDAMIALLSGAGIPDIVRNGISDLSINNRKILGSSLYLGTRPSFYYYQSSLLVAPDLSLFERYLYYPPREPGYRHRRPHRDFCTSLAQEGHAIAAPTVVELISARLPEYLQDGK
jgi:lipoate---protein ligase